MQDSLTPDRIVFGVTSPAAEALMRAVYATPLASGIPGLTMDLETAELVKVAANAFLATKISFINVMAEMCEASGRGRDPAGRRDRHRRADRPQVPLPRPRLRRRLPAQGHPRLPGHRRRAAASTRWSTC